MQEAVESVEELIAGVLEIVRSIERDEAHALAPEAGYALHFFVREAARLGFDELAAWLSHYLGAVSAGDDDAERARAQVLRVLDALVLEYGEWDQDAQKEAPKT